MRTMNTDCTPRYPTLTPEEIATMDAASRLRYLDAMLDEGDDDDDPGIPHEQVMAKAWADVERLVRKSA